MDFLFMDYAAQTQCLLFAARTLQATCIVSQSAASLDQALESDAHTFVCRQQESLALSRFLWRKR